MSCGLLAACCSSDARIADRQTLQWEGAKPCLVSGLLVAIDDETGRVNLAMGYLTNGSLIVMDMAGDCSLRVQAPASLDKMVQLVKTLDDGWSTREFVREEREPQFAPYPGRLYLIEAHCEGETALTRYASPVGQPLGFMGVGVSRGTDERIPTMAQFDSIEEIEQRVAALGVFPAAALGAPMGEEGGG